MPPLGSCFASVQISFVWQHAPPHHVTLCEDSSLANALRPVLRHCALVKQTGFAKLISSGKKKVMNLVGVKEFRFHLALKGRWRLDYYEKTFDGNIVFSFVY